MKRARFRLSPGVGAPERCTAASRGSREAGPWPRLLKLSPGDVPPERSSAQRLMALRGWDLAAAMRPSQEPQEGHNHRDRDQDPGRDVVSENSEQGQ